jgi:hypothetical protein
MKIYLDFDGTVVEHQYPKIGRENFGGLEVVKALQEKGHDIILNTYRADCNDGTLQQAVEFIDFHPKHELKPLHSCAEKKIHPNPWDIDKAIECGELYLDDIAHNMPIKDAVTTNHSMVNWDEVKRQLIEKGVL